LLALAVREELGDTYNLSCCEQWNQGQGAARTVPVNSRRAHSGTDTLETKDRAGQVRESRQSVRDHGDRTSRNARSHSRWRSQLHPRTSQ